MGLPIIKIDFKELAKTVAIRSKRGIVALILKDSTTSKFIIQTESDIPTSLSEANKGFIKDCLIGNVTSPNRILCYVIGGEDTLADALAYFETQEFNLITMCGAVVEDNTAIKAFVDKMNNVVNYKCDCLLADTNQNKEYVFNYTAKNIVVGGVNVATNNYVARIAGLICGTPLHQAITFSVLPEVDSVEVLTKEQADSRINAGEIILVREMGKIRVARGVTSLVSQTPTYLSKIKLRQTTNLIHNDVRKVLVEKYIGKVPNNYNNKCVLITEINGYLGDLSKEQLIENDFSVGIDIDAQRRYLKDNTNLDVENMSEQAIKEANTGDKVFLVIKIKLIDAMEEIYINIIL